jgi:hypothetical protein
MWSQEDERYSQQDACEPHCGEAQLTQIDLRHQTIDELPKGTEKLPSRHEDLMNRFSTMISLE